MAVLSPPGMILMDGDVNPITISFTVQKDEVTIKVSTQTRGL